MATFAETKGHNPANIRKFLEMALFAKPVEDADTAITQVYTTADGLTIPAGYKPLGVVTKDNGATWSRNQENSEVTSMGYAEPTRTDVLSDVTGLAFTLQESKRIAFELYHGLDLSGVVTDADGNIMFDKASRPVKRKYRVIALGKDGDGPDAIYCLRWLPNAEVTENADQSWQEGEETRYPATLTGRVDEGFGTSFREIWGGPGLDPVAMDFPEKPTPWAASTAYTVGDTVSLTGGAVLQATVAGTSGTTEPTAPAVGATVTDGTVTWKRLK